MSVQFEMINNQGFVSTINNAFIFLDSKKNYLPPTLKKKIFRVNFNSMQINFEILIWVDDKLLNTLTTAAS